MCRVAVGQGAPRLDMALLKRFLLMAGVWLALSANASGGWLFGAAAALAAAWLSLRLLPPAAGAVRLRPAARLLWDFVAGSVVGGIDVARRAFDPRLPLRPGWLRHPLQLGRGTRRTVLGDMLSLMPGTLAAGEEGPCLLVHCLDTGPPASHGIAECERRVSACVDEAAGGIRG